MPKRVVLDGWVKNDDIWEKRLVGVCGNIYWFTISEWDHGCELRVERMLIAKRPTLKECMQVAEDTIKLWR